MVIKRREFKPTKHAYIITFQRCRLFNWNDLIYVLYILARGLSASPKIDSFSYPQRSICFPKLTMYPRERCPRIFGGGNCKFVLSPFSCLHYRMQGIAIKVTITHEEGPYNVVKV